jgi:glycosyltransferase involved in cell wall biosynthesis
MYRDDNISGITDNKKVLNTIPAFNEQESIARVVNIAKKFADHVIVIDDGSTDKTAERHKRQDEKCLVIPSI